jgi:hypothetical protein
LYELGEIAQPVEKVGKYLHYVALVR